MSKKTKLGPLKETKNVLAYKKKRKKKSMKLKKKRS